MKGGPSLSWSHPAFDKAMRQTSPAEGGSPAYSILMAKCHKPNNPQTDRSDCLWTHRSVITTNKRKSDFAISIIFDAAEWAVD